MAQTFSKIIKLSIIFLLILACSDTQEEVEVNDISLPPEGPPSYPYIFEGKFYLNGEPGKEGLHLYAKLGDLDSPIVVTDNGYFENLIIGPKVPEDMLNVIEFYLIENSMPIKSKKEIQFQKTNKPKFEIIELKFDS